MPLYTTEALILRTYKLAEADRIVVFLTRDRGKKRGVAPNGRRSLKRFGAALEPLTEVRWSSSRRPQLSRGACVSERRRLQLKLIVDRGDRSAVPET